MPSELAEPHTPDHISLAVDVPPREQAGLPPIEMDSKGTYKAPVSVPLDIVGVPTPPPTAEDFRSSAPPPGTEGPPPVNEWQTPFESRALLGALADEEHGHESLFFGPSEEVFEDLRETLSKSENKSVAALSDDHLATVVKKDAEELAKEHQERHEELIGYRDEFIQEALKASELGWIPLTKDQILDRITKTQVVFGSRLAIGNGIGGDHIGDYDVARILVGTSPEVARRNVFHELTHALAGRRATVLEEFEQPTEENAEQEEQTRRWTSQTGLYAYRGNSDGQTHTEGRVYDEALTDTISLVLEQGSKLGLFRKKPKQVKQIIDRTLKHELSTYEDEKSVALNVLTALELPTLMNAYFKEDNDHLEEDPLAKTHAMRELHRELKHARGIKATKVFRLVDRVFDGEETPETIQMEDRDGPEIAKEILAPNFKTHANGGIVKKQLVKRHQRRRNKGIKKAKELLEQQEAA